MAQSYVADPVADHHPEEGETNQPFKACKQCFLDIPTEMLSIGISISGFSMRFYARPIMFTGIHIPNCSSEAGTISSSVSDSEWSAHNPLHFSHICHVGIHPAQEKNSKEIR